MVSECYRISQIFDTANRISLDFMLIIRNYESLLLLSVIELPVNSSPLGANNICSILRNSNLPSSLNLCNQFVYPHKNGQNCIFLYFISNALLEDKRF
jgi:hypothetical protein